GGIEVTLGDPSGTVAGGDEHERRPFGVPLPDLHVLAGHHLDGRPVRDLMGRGGAQPGHAGILAQRRGAWGPGPGGQPPRPGRPTALMSGLSFRYGCPAVTSLRVIAADTVTVSVQSVDVSSDHADGSLHISRAIAAPPGAVNVAGDW